MKRALWSAAFMLLFSMTMLLGTTFAWFSETYSFKGNQITFGNLDMKLEYCDPALKDVEGDIVWYDIDEHLGKQLFDQTKNEYGIHVQPGFKLTKYVRISNVGNINFKVNYALEKLDDYNKITLEVNNADSALRIKGKMDEPVVVKVGETKYIAVTLTVKGHLGNEFEAETLQLFDLYFNAEQSDFRDVVGEAD